MKKTIIVTGAHATELQTGINKYQDKGFESVGSHKVVTTHVQNRFAGLQHKDSVHRSEWSITMTKEEA